jgi:hypothetical protein
MTKRAVFMKKTRVKKSHASVPSRFGTIMRIIVSDTKICRSVQYASYFKS